MPPAPSHTGREPLAVPPGLIVKAMTFVAAPANDSAFRHRRYAVQALSVPTARTRDEPSAGQEGSVGSPAAPLAALPFALAGAWTSAHLALWDRCLTDSLRRPIQLATGSSLLRLLGGSLEVSAALAAACFESLADLGGAALDRGTAPFRR